MLNIVYRLSLLCFIGFLNLVDKTESILCYECGIDKKFPCEKFDENNSDYIRNCSSLNGHSCRIYRNNNTRKVFKRSCEEIKIDVCKTSNFIDYCFCTSDFCNKFLLSGGEGDDEEDQLEDSVEGSGYNSSSTTVEEEQVTPSSGDLLTNASRFDIDEFEENSAVAHLFKGPNRLFIQISSIYLVFNQLF